MVSISLHARTVKKLSSGEYSVEVSMVQGYFPGGAKPSSNAWNITLPSTTKNAEKLLEPAIVDEPAAAWIASHGGEWDKELVREYFECILER